MTHRPDPPTISVIIPARNEEALLASTLESVLRARAHFGASGGNRSAVEILVVDNGSTDRTPEILDRYADSSGVRSLNCADRGSAHARNHGARLASGQILIFLDADTHLPPGAIRRVATLCQELRYEAGITALGALDGGRRARCWWAFWNAVRRLPLARAKAMPACMFCTQEAFAEFGPFDERVAIGEEWPILAGLYRARRGRLAYDRSTVALSSGRRMELQRFGYLRTLAKYGWAILSFRGRVHYHDRVRHASTPEALLARTSEGPDRSAGVGEAADQDPRPTSAGLGDLRKEDLVSKDVPVDLSAPRLAACLVPASPLVDAGS